MKILVIFENLGPYHVARLRELAKRTNLLVVEELARSESYAWNASDSVPFKRVTLNSGEKISTNRLKKSKISQAILDEIRGFKPDVVVVPGWSRKVAFFSAIHALDLNIPLIVMSETQEIDFKRNWMIERAKMRYLGYFSGALVGGEPHRDYMIKLGVPRGNVKLGYDVVDNDYFEKHSREVRILADLYRSKHGLPQKYFLASARFVEKKNLLFLIRAFSDFRRKLSARAAPPENWHLVLLGDGILRSKIESLVFSLGLSDSVMLPGFKQYHELSAFYGLASAFILPSSTEQWGLVVNEAMAAGLPVLVSERCGCARDLVLHGDNGVLFAPDDIGDLSNAMLLIALDEDLRTTMGCRSLEIIRNWSPNLFASNLIELAESARKSGSTRDLSIFDRALMRLMALKSP